MSIRKRFSKLSANLVASLAFAVLPASAADFHTGTYASPGFTLTFDGDGHFRGSQKGAVKVEGDYVANGDQLQLTDKDGPWACAGAGQRSGTYRWKSEGDTLTFNKVTDTCKDRVGSLTSHPWKKQG